MEWTERLRGRRVELGLTQDEVARHLGRTRGAVSQWETSGQGKPHGFLPPADMRRLAELLRMPLHVLMWGDGPEAAAGSLSPDEQALLAGYRKLPDEQRRIVKGVIDGFLGAPPLADGRE